MSDPHGDGPTAVPRKPAPRAALQGRGPRPEVTAGPDRPSEESDDPPADDRPPDDPRRELEALLSERTEDLRRLKAEYDNYRKRVHRDQLAVREIAVANVLSGLLPVLDALDRARQLGDLRGGAEAVAELLEEHLGALGLASFGEVGEPFDPTVHEAVYFDRTSAVAEPTCTEIVRPGYRVGDHLLRPAEVVVSEPPPA